MAKEQKWHSYISTHPVDHGAVAGIFLQQVDVEEKIDGDLLAVSVKDDQLMMSTELDPAEEPIVEHLRGQQFLLNPEYIYFLEILREQQGARIEYGRAPRAGAILLDVRTPEGWLQHEEKFQIAEQLGFECAPLLYQGYVTDHQQLASFLQTESMLGGQIEGIIIKPVHMRGEKLRFAKFQTPEYQARVAFSRVPRAALEGAGPQDIESFLKSAHQRAQTRELPRSTEGEVLGSGDGL